MRIKSLYYVGTLHIHITYTNFKFLQHTTFIEFYGFFENTYLVILNMMSYNYLV